MGIFGILVGREQTVLGKEQNFQCYCLRLWCAPRALI